MLTCTYTPDQSFYPIGDRVIGDYMTSTNKRELKHKEEACRGNVRYSFAFKAFTFQEKGGFFLLSSLDEKVNTTVMSLLRRPADTKPGWIISVCLCLITPKRAF